MWAGAAKIVDLLEVRLLQRLLVLPPPLPPPEFMRFFNETHALTLGGGRGGSF